MPGVAPTDKGGVQLVGCSRAIVGLRALLPQVARTTSTVLITGESGTGKEVLARALHAWSPRSAYPFLAVNSPALPESLAEAELFGYEKGAFTGAALAKPGLFEQAHLGTLLLDEIADMSPPMQAKLLRVLQDREAQRLGGTRRYRVDVRVVAATNRDLASAIRERWLREDLYYRLCVVHVHLPPLRERLEDVPLLCAHFLRHYAPLNGSRLHCISDAARAVLQNCRWPGNVRELENAMQYATIMAAPEDGDVLLIRHLPAEVRGEAPEREAAADAAASLRSACLDLGSAVQGVRRQYAEEALRRAAGNKAEAARLLGLSRRGFYNLLGSTGGAAGSGGPLL
jgi:transcriptional regulator with PAS, ATPase and Fis domain